MTQPSTETETASSGRFYPLVDHRCKDHRCDEPNVYRMVGSCTNCHHGPLLILLTARHRRTSEALCPKCGNYTVTCQRLAEDDELPAGG